MNSVEEVEECTNRFLASFTFPSPFSPVFPKLLLKCFHPTLGWRGVNSDFYSQTKKFRGGRNRLIITLLLALSKSI